MLVPNFPVAVTVPKYEIVTFPMFSPLRIYVRSEYIVNILECRGNVTSNTMKSVYWPLMGGLLQARPLFAVPNVGQMSMQHLRTVITCTTLHTSVLQSIKFAFSPVFKRFTLL